MNYSQQEKKLEKLKILLENYRDLKDKVCSIKELSEILGKGFSRSTIQRYFHELFEQRMINEKEYQEIQEWLIRNKDNGLSTGGIVSQGKHGYTKDEKGHFKGSKK